MKALPALALLGLLALPTDRSLLAQEHDEPASELAAHMEKIEDTLKLLRRSLKDEAARPAALEALVEIQRLTLACKGLQPASAAALPEAERQSLVTAYRRTMVDFLTRQLELEAALLDGDAEAAKAAFERLKGMEDTAHERFAPEED